MPEKFSLSFVMYKATRDGNGAASQWDLAKEKQAVFLEMTNQIGKDDKGNARFDWDNKISFKLGQTDIGEILSVLVGMQDGVGQLDRDKNKHKGLFHSNQGGNSILYFAKDERGTLRMYLSVKKGENKTVAQHAISKGEMCILSTLLRRAIEVMYEWK